MWCDMRENRGGWNRLAGWCRGESHSSRRGIEGGAGPIAERVTDTSAPLFELLDDLDLALEDEARDEVLRL